MAQSENNKITDTEVTSFIDCHSITRFNGSRLVIEKTVKVGAAPVQPKPNVLPTEKHAREAHTND
jgi:hypothetical protein